MKKVKGIRNLCFLTLVFCLTIGTFLIVRITFSAGSGTLPNKPPSQPAKSAVAAAPNATPPTETLLPTATLPLTQTPATTTEVATPAQTQQQTSVSRIKVIIGETLDVPIAAGLDSAIVVSPEIAAAQIKNGRGLAVTGLKIGETILMVSANQKRLTFIIQVTGKPSVSERRENIVSSQRPRNEKSPTSGSYSARYVQGFDGSPSLLRNNIDFKRKLSEDRTLRVSGEMFKLIGNTDRNRVFAQIQGFGLNRLSVGIDSPDKTIDFLDSQVRVSPLSLNGFAMRGFHLVTKPNVKTPKSSSNVDLRKKGIEIYAGLARPSLTLYDADRGKLAGAMLPVAGGESWEVRAGFTTVIAEKDNRIGRSGTVLQLTGLYAPSKKFSAEGEIAYSGGGLSWRARADLKLRGFGAFGEIVRFDKNSPLSSIRAQSGGRLTEALAVNWQPDRRLNFSARYNHTKITRLANSVFADFNRTTFSAGASYKISRNSRLNLRFLNQQIETAVPASTEKFQIETRSLAIGHNIRFNKNWTNDFEARLNFSSESGANAELEKGFNLKEQLRFSWNRNSVTGFFNYTYNTPSLTSLIVRNPRILPPLLQPAFTFDPTAFLQVYQDRLAFLLPGIELPQTRSFDAGLRFQTTVSRFTLTGETRYNAGEILSRNQNNLYASVGLNMRLDAANSFQISGRQSFGTNSQSAVTFSFTHRFGSESSGGFQLSKLLGLDKGKVQGRIYYDLNGNGQDDADEPGAAGMTIKLNEKRSVKTDANGRYEFSANEGGYNIALVSEDLGVRLRASTATQQRISLSPQQTLNVSFGVMSFGFVSGRIFNDSNMVGASGVRLILRSPDVKSRNIVAATTDRSGTYEFRNLHPGNYTLEIDPATLPVNFKLPAQASWEIKVEPLQGFYLDIPITAQRAIAGIIFIDKDGDGKFNPQKDEPVEGAYVLANGSSAISDRNGAYILRNLPAGKIKLLVRSPQGAENAPVILELGAEPVTKRAVNLVLQR